MRKRMLLLAVPMFILLFAAVLFLVSRAPDTREEVVISIPYNQYIRNIDTNYYKEWLEEQTGLSIRFNIIYETVTADYLRSMFASGYVQSDAFFSFPDTGIDYHEVLQEFGELGYIIPLNSYVEQSVYLSAVFEQYPEYDLQSLMTSPDRNIYFMPAFDPSTPERHFQVLWLNQSWLNALRLRIPRTTDELREVLYAFKNQNPDGGVSAIPLAGSYETASQQVFNFIINAFVYNDPMSSRMFIENGAVCFAPVTSEWREAMKYLSELYGEGLLSHFQFSTDHNGLAVLANNPQNLLGGFAGKSISDVIFPSNDGIINDFIHVAPIAGPAGVRAATVLTPTPKPSGVITSNAKNPEAVFKLLDLMMSEEAFLVGRFGEEGVDWVRAQGTDINSYGGRATVRVINRLRHTAQNKHINESGPFFAYPKYANGVAFSGFQSDQEYVDARAYRAYEQFMPDEFIRTIRFDGADASELQTLRRAIDTYTDESIEAFITGVKDPFDDAVWEAHIAKYQAMGLERLIKAIHNS